MLRLYVVVCLFINALLLYRTFCAPKSSISQLNSGSGLCEQLTHLLLHSCCVYNKLHRILYIKTFKCGVRMINHRIASFSLNHTDTLYVAEAATDFPNSRFITCTTFNRWERKIDIYETVNTAFDSVFS